MLDEVERLLVVIESHIAVVEPGDGERDRHYRNAFPDVLEQFEELKERVDEIPTEQISPDTVDTRFDAIESQLSDIDASLGDLPAEITSAMRYSVPATVLRENGLVLLRVAQEDIDGIERALEHGQELTVLIEATDESPSNRSRD